MYQISDSLNEEQMKAVTWNSGPLLLLAGPGSGKTTVIINRILYLLNLGVSPNHILVVTFTKEAAEMMQKRFFDCTDQHESVVFGTFHSFFYHILKESGGFKQFQLISSYEQIQIIIQILKQLPITDKTARDVAELNEIAMKVLSAISYYKNTNEIEIAKAKLDEDYQDHFVEIAKCYEEQKKRVKKLDFDDMLYQCRKLLNSDSKIRMFWQSRFQYILIDEFQDINPIQYEILRLLASKETGVFAVGDDDQSIYGFRGSKPILMRKYLNDFKAKSLLLTLNYRSDYQIVNASLSVINCNRMRFEKNLAAYRNKVDLSGCEVHVSIKEFENREEQNAYLCEALRGFLKNSQNSGEKCAVLFRTNSIMQALAIKLKEKKIPFLMKEKVSSIFEHFIVKDVMAYLVIAEYEEWIPEQFIRILNKPKRMISREAVIGNSSIEEMIDWYRNSGLTEYALREVIYNLQVLQRQLLCMKGLSLPLKVQYICKAIGYEEYLLGKSRDKNMKAEWVGILEWLKEESKCFRTAAQWLAFQEDYKASIRNDNCAKQNCRNTSQMQIHLMTAHASKGLEFHTVYIPDCNEKIFPHGNQSEPEYIEEERRLFYVAMTRAREKLILSYVKSDGMGARGISRFLHPLIKKGDT